MGKRTWTVTYEGQNLELETPEYRRLRQLAQDDPVEAEKEVLRLLKEQTKSQLS